MIIRRDALKAALAATTTDETRYALSCLQITPDGQVRATDGVIALVATDRAPFPDADYPTVPEAGISTGELTAPVLLERTAVAGLIKATAPKDTIPILTAVRLGQNGTGTVAVATDLQTRSIVRIDPLNGQQFPAIERVLPAKDKPALAVCLGVPVLEALIKAAKAIGAKGITFRVPTEPQHQGKHEPTPDHPKGRPDGVIQTPLRVDLQGTDVAIEGAAMPMRI